MQLLQNSNTNMYSIRTDKNIALAEFVSYALSNEIFGTKLNETIQSTDTGLIEPIDVGTSAIARIIRAITDWINNLMGRKDSHATAMLQNVLLELNGVSIKKKNRLIQVVESVTQNLRTLDAKLKYLPISDKIRATIMVKASAVITVGKEV